MPERRPVKPRLLITEPEYFTPGSIRRLFCVARVEARRLTRTQLLRRAHLYEALAVRIETRVDRALIDRARRLKCVATATTGIDHIDTAYLKEKGIPFFSLNQEHSLPTAEHALALMSHGERSMGTLELRRGGAGRKDRGDFRHRAHRDFGGAEGGRFGNAGFGL